MASPRTWSLFTKEEDTKLIKFLCESNRFHETRGVKVWQDMVTAKAVTERTHQSLKNRFQKYLCDKLDTVYKGMLDHYSIRLPHFLITNRGRSLREKLNSSSKSLEWLEAIVPQRRTPTPSPERLTEHQDDRSKRRHKIFSKNNEFIDSSSSSLSISTLNRSKRYSSKRMSRSAIFSDSDDSDCIQGTPKEVGSRTTGKFESRVEAGTETRTPVNVVRPLNSQSSSPPSTPSQSSLPLNSPVSGPLKKTSVDKLHSILMRQTKRIVQMRNNDRRNMRNLKLLYLKHVQLRKKFRRQREAVRGVIRFLSSAGGFEDKDPSYTQIFENGEYRNSELLRNMMAGLSSETRKSLIEKLAEIQDA